jgi:hypothetical protein
MIKKRCSTWTTPSALRLRRMVTARCSIKVVGALRCRGTPINFPIAPNGSLVQIESYWATGTFDCTDISAAPDTALANDNCQLAASLHPKCR